MEWDPTKNQGRVPIGGKPKRKNQKVQVRANAELKKKAEAESSSQATNEPTWQEMLGIVETIIRDWSAEDGDIIAKVMNQHDKDICWAICFARIVQAIHNIGLPVNQHVVMSFSELIDQIKSPKTEKFELANLKIAFDRISKKGILKEPTTQKRSQKANAKGKTVQQSLHLCENVDASFVEARLDTAPVALILQLDADFLTVGQEGTYYLPKKGNITEEGPLHSMLLIGYGRTGRRKNVFHWPKFLR